MFLSYAKNMSASLGEKGYLVTMLFEELMATPSGDLFVKSCVGTLNVFWIFAAL